MAIRYYEYPRIVKNDASVETVNGGIDGLEDLGNSRSDQVFSSTTAAGFRRLRSRSRYQLALHESASPGWIQPDRKAPQRNLKGFPF